MQNVYINELIKIALPNKYTGWYISIISKALIRATDRRSAKLILGYSEAHHILPKSFDMTGNKDVSNLVYLSAKEHFIVHCLLVKMFSGKFKQKMSYAFWQLRRKNKHQNDRYFNSRIYDYLKNKEYPFIRLYLLDRVKFVYKTEIDEIDNLIKLGWNTKMTEEYKVGRVGGNRKGKFHTDRSKQLMCANASKIWKGRHLSEEHRTKISQANKGAIRTAEFNEHCQKKLFQQYASGNMNNSGENNPMYGRNRKPLFNPETNQQRFIEIRNDDFSEVEAMLKDGWKLGFKPRKRRVGIVYKK